MVHRLVSKSEAPTPEAAVQFILDSTGGAVMHATAFPVIEEVDCWRVPVWSDSPNAESVHVDFQVCDFPTNRELAHLRRYGKGN